MTALAIISLSFGAIPFGLVPPPTPCGPVPSERQLRRLRLETGALVHLGLPTFLDRDAVEPTDDRSLFRVKGFSAGPWIDDLRSMGVDGLVLVVRGDDGISLAERGMAGPVASAAGAARIPFAVSLSGSGDGPPIGAEIGDLCRRLGPFFEVRVTGEAVDADRAALETACGTAAFAARDDSDFLIAALGEPVATRAEPWQGIERFVSIRPSRYWRLAEDDRLLGVPELEDAWFRTVAQGEPLLIGIPADRDGAFRRGDVSRIAAFRERIATVRDRDLIREATISASTIRGGDSTYGPERLRDADDSTYWASDDGVDQASIECGWPEPVTIGILELREPPTLGRRCDAWVAEARVDGAWREIARGDTIGLRRSERFPAVRADRLRLRLFSSGCPLALERIAVFAAPPDVRLAAGETGFSTRTEAILEADRPDASVRFTLDGRDPVEFGTPSHGPIPIESSCILRAVALDDRGRAGHPISIRFTRLDSVPFLAPIAEAASGESGLSLEIHDGVSASLDELAGRAPRAVTTISDIRLPGDRPPDRFALVYRGFLRVPADGLYTFSLRSDDGSRLYLHDRLVIERDGLQVYDVREGRVALRQGLHPIRVEFCEFEGRESLSLSWSVAGGRLERIPAEAFSR